MLISSIRHLGMGWLLACLALAAEAEELPEWTGRIRTDHPRLFFNAQT